MYPNIAVTSSLSTNPNWVLKAEPLVHLALLSNTSGYLAYAVICLTCSSVQRDDFGEITSIYTPMRGIRTSYAGRRKNFIKNLISYTEESKRCFCPHFKDESELVYLALNL